MAPFDDSVDPAAQAKAIVAELKKVRSCFVCQAPLVGFEQDGTWCPPMSAQPRSKRS
jgi:hypothetical protein